VDFGSAAENKACLDSPLQASSFTAIETCKSRAFSKTALPEIPTSHDLQVGFPTDFYWPGISTEAAAFILTILCRGVLTNDLSLSTLQHVCLVCEGKIATALLAKAKTWCVN
jgi:hypothetical protein